MIDRGLPSEAQLDRIADTRHDSLIRQGLAECVDGLRSWRIWYLIGSADMRRRYARSRLGQTWIVLSTGATVFALGWLWSQLWQMPWKEMLLYIGVSLVLWQFLSGLITEFASAFSSNAHFFMNQHVSPMSVVMAVIYRNLLALAHNAVVIVLLLAITGTGVGWQLLLLVPATALVLLLACWSGYLLAAVCVRYRDVVQVVGIVVQFGFFFTPIIWRPEQAPPEVQWLLLINPLHMLMEIMRGPLIGSDPKLWAWLVVALLAVGGFAASLPLIGWLRSWIKFWV